MNDLIFLITLYLFSYREEFISIIFYVIPILKLPVIIIFTIILIRYLTIILESRPIQQTRINQRTNNIVSVEPSIIILDESGNFRGITRKDNRIQNRIRPVPLT
jgi:hypothetical protein